MWTRLACPVRPTIGSLPAPATSPAESRAGPGIDWMRELWATGSGGPADHTLAMGRAVLAPAVPGRPGAVSGSRYPRLDDRSRGDGAGVGRSPAALRVQAEDEELTTMSSAAEQAVRDRPTDGSGLGWPAEPPPPGVPGDAASPDRSGRSGLGWPSPDDPGHRGSAARGARCGRPGRRRVAGSRPAGRGRCAGRPGGCRPGGCGPGDGGPDDERSGVSPSTGRHPRDRCPVAGG